MQHQNRSITWRTGTGRGKRRYNFLGCSAGVVICALSHCPSRPSLHITTMAFVLHRIPSPSWCLRMDPLYTLTLRPLYYPFLREFFVCLLHCHIYSWFLASQSRLKSVETMVDHPSTFHLNLALPRARTGSKNLPTRLWTPETTLGHDFLALHKCLCLDDFNSNVAIETPLPPDVTQLRPRLMIAGSISPLDDVLDNSGMTGVLAKKEFHA